MVFKYDDIDPALRHSIEKGVIAIRRANETFANWLAVGQACADMQTAAMRLAGANEPKGRGYNDAFKAIAAEVPDLAKLDKTTRSHAIWAADPLHRQAIEAWHAALPDKIRQQVNHPSVVKRRYERETAPPPPPQKAPPDFLDDPLQGTAANLRSDFLTWMQHTPYDEWDRLAQLLLDEIRDVKRAFPRLRLEFEAAGKTE